MAKKKVKKNHIIFATSSKREKILLYLKCTGIILLSGGIQYNSIVLVTTFDFNVYLKIFIPGMTWILIAFLFAYYFIRRIKREITDPLENLQKKMKLAEDGDLSVYVSPSNIPNEYNEIDEIIIHFNSLVQKLSESEILNTDFVSNVSHEMKTPLSVIDASVQMLQTGSLTKEEEQEYLQQISISVTRMSTLITNILRLNKLENQKITPNLERIDICAVLCDLIISYDQIVEQKNINLDVDLADDRCFIISDKEFLEIVFNNLMSNAVKFTPEGGNITIKEHSDDKMVYIAVQDNGIGMDEKTKKYIFEKFYQGDTSHSTVGNGLGLALVQRILNILDGAITVESAPDQGSTFEVSFRLEAG